MSNEVIMLIISAVGLVLSIGIALSASYANRKRLGKDEGIFLSDISNLKGVISDIKEDLKTIKGIDKDLRDFINLKFEKVNENFIGLIERISVVETAADRVHARLDGLNMAGLPSRTITKGRGTKNV